MRAYFKKWRAAKKAKKEKEVTEFTAHDRRHQAYIVAEHDKAEKARVEKAKAKEALEEAVVLVTANFGEEIAHQLLVAATKKAKKAKKEKLLAAAKLEAEAKK